MINKKEHIKKLCEEIGYNPEFILQNLVESMDDFLFSELMRKARESHPELFPLFVDEEGNVVKNLKP